MQTLNIYIYTAEDGKCGVRTPFKIAGASNYTEKYCLVADEGKVLTDGTQQVQCIDVATTDKEKWSEIDKPEETTTETAK